MVQSYAKIMVNYGIVSEKNLHIAEILHKHATIFLIDCDSTCNFALSKQTNY